MRREVIVEGNTYNAALEKGLKALGVEPGKAKVEVIQEGRTMMGIVIKPYRLLLYVEEESRQAGESQDKQLPQSFALEYKEDGVYLTVFIPPSKFTKSDEETIMHHLRRKRIEGLMVDAAAQAMYKNPGRPVKVAEPQPELPVDEEVLVYISQDGMQATIMLLPPEGGRLLTYQDVIQALKDKGVVYGIDEDAIRQALNSRRYGQEVIVAHGQPPQDGEDARLTYHFKPDRKSKPEIREDGTVNYHSLDNIENVTKGQVLVTLIPPTPGVDGKTVCGTAVHAKPGKPLILPAGKNVVVSDDGLKLVAAIDGKVEMIGGRVHVYSVHEVKNNVDNSTGNINFVGSVIIHGNVLSGFEVRAGGSIEVRGVVEGATLIAEGDVVLRKGLQGMKKGVVQAGGSVTARFIENGSVYAKGDVTAEAIMHSNIVSGQHVRLIGKRALIVGGRVHAALGISASTIGSPMATATILEVGISPEIRQEYEQLKEELQRLEKEQHKIEQVMAVLSRMESSGRLPPDKLITKQKALRARDEYSVKIPAIKARIFELEEAFLRGAQGKVHVKKVIYPGVSITIGQSTLNIKDPINYVTFLRDEGEVRFVTYEG
ncbi:FapA family protein [Caldicoprobacter algeriensis]|uniref:FapA family protein n=1 Tax=Caldicoprobacter algeriensis TaxID=699281 RepID=UPI0020796436|nr:FapA family protein [Caldicoprobacter algeriensis]